MVRCGMYPIMSRMPPAGVLKSEGGPRSIAPFAALLQSESGRRGAAADPAAAAAPKSGSAPEMHETVVES